MEYTRTKNKYKIIIKNLEELKLYIILIEKDSRLETISGFVHFYSGVSKEKKEVSIILKRKLNRSVTD